MNHKWIFIESDESYELRSGVLYERRNGVILLTSVLNIELMGIWILLYVEIWSNTDHYTHKFQDWQQSNDKKFSKSGFLHKEDFIYFSIDRIFGTDLVRVTELLVCI